MGEGEDERRCCSGEDRISGLPDELLHVILVRLRSAPAAGRTSVLSRRWRYVWAHLPELRLDAPRAAAPASFLDTVDGALAGYLAPTLGYLSISLHPRDVSITAARVAPWLQFSLHPRDVSITAARVAPWLQFAAEHMAGEIDLFVSTNPLRFPPSPPRLFEQEVVEDEAVLDLPACEGAKRIKLFLTHEWRLRLQASSLFTALTSMKIMGGCMDGSELTSLVCTQCPCLRDLALFLKLIVVSDISFHSNSLYSVKLLVRNTRRLEVVAPKLEKLKVHCHPMEAHISAPKLAEVVWGPDAYNPQLHRFADVGRSLRLLEINKTSLVPSLGKQFDEADELELDISISEGVAGYESFLNETNKLPKCKSIRIFLMRAHHALMPSVLYLLNRCNSTKISVLLRRYRKPPLGHSCPPSCPCRLEENQKINGVALSSLEEAEISDFTDSFESMELVQFLSCNAAILKRLVINYMVFFAPPVIKEVCEKVRGICHANVEVKFNVFRSGRLVPFD